MTAFAALCLTDDQGIPLAPAAHHLLWLRLMCDTSIKRLLIVAPPEAAKTTWATALIATRIGLFPESNTVIASVDSATAEKRSVTIRNMITSPVWQSIFPDILPAEGMQFTHEEWSVAPNGKPSTGRLHPTLRSYGTGQAIVGSRADLLLGDDLISYDLARTEGMRKTVSEWFHSSFLSRLKAGGRVILIGTSWGESDLYADIRKSNEGWVICHTPLLSETDCIADISWPDSYAGVKIGEQCQSQPM